MSSRNSAKIIPLLILMSLLAGCAQHQIYRPKIGPCISSQPESECTDTAIQIFRPVDDPGADYSLGFIEFDDQGQLWSRGLMRKVVNWVNGEAGRRDLLMVVFVHGWKHSAEPRDGNIRTFRESLMRLSRLESAVYKEKARKVVGIYLGWRGGSVDLPLIENLTFWDRKNTAHKVGQGAVAEVLRELDSTRQSKNALAEKGGITRLVVIGHSFGGAVLHSALSQLLMDRFVATKGPVGANTDVPGFGDLLVQINPAFEAMRFSTLSDMANERRRYFPSQLPVLAILTSEADQANKYAFPLGRSLSTVFELHRETERTNAVTRESETIDQKTANITAVGFFDPYKTHYLKATSVTAGCDEKGDYRPESLDASKLRFARAGESWENDHPGSEIEFDGSRLIRSENSAGRNPYLIIRVDENLICGHNDLDDPRIASFIRQLIMISSQQPELTKRRAFRARIKIE